MLPFIVAGLTTGSIFALAAVGLVLTYKTSGIFNFAHGAMASASAFLFYFLHEEHRLPWPVAALICVAAAGPLVGLLLEWIARHLTNGNIATRVFATVGVLLTIQGGLELLFPPGPDREVAQFLPTRAFHIGSTAIGANRIIVFAVGLVTVVALTLYLRSGKMGLAMRAVVDNTELLDLMGTSPARVRRVAWVIGSVTVSGSGVLLAPLLPLDATSMTLLVVTAFGAAAVGAFTNLPLTYLGGLAIGITQAILQKYLVSSTGLTAGLAASLPFLILFALLVGAPRLRRPSPLRARLAERSAPWRAPWTVRTFGGSAILILLLLAPEFAGLHLINWTDSLAYVVLFLSLGLLVRMSGQVSLAHVSFMAIGVAAFSHTAVDHHWPWGLALLFAAIVAAPIGAVLAIPAIRFPGLYLALATLGFGILLTQMFFGQHYMFGQQNAGLEIPRPHLGWLSLDSDRGYYYLVLAITALVALLVIVLSRSRLGRLLQAMSDSTIGLRSSGTSINVCRVLVFSLSASLAAVAGVLDGGVVGIVGESGYQPLQSLQLFAVLMLTVGRAPWYALVAAFAQVLLPSYISLSSTVTYAFTLWFGVNAILFSVTPESRRTLPVALQHLIGRLGPVDMPRRRRRPTPVVAAPVSVESLPEERSRLSIENLSVQFASVTVVDNVSIDALSGRITGLIGPNGAGKSTIFNACTGLVRPATGRIRFNDSQFDHLGTASRARRGLGRTFQQMELFDSMTVRENVALGREAAFAGWNPLDHLVATRRQRTVVSERCDDALVLCGLEDVADIQVGAMSTGQRRLVELARCIAGDYDIVLLDEPSSGLDRLETQRFGDILQRIVRERNVGILLVEHDMALVNRICDHVFVIDFGKQIFEGSVNELVASPVVREAYLGKGDPAEAKTVVETGAAR